MRATARLSLPWVSACLAAVLAASLAYAAVVFRDTLQAEALARDIQTARLVAQAISAADAEADAARRLLEAAFDPARHDRIRLVDTQGRVLVALPLSHGGPAGRDRRADDEAASPGPEAVHGLASAPVMVGTRLAGQVQIHSRSAAWGAPWREAVSMLALGLAALGLTAGALLAFGALRSRQAHSRLALAVRRIGLGEPAGDALPLRGEWAALGEDLTAASGRVTRLQAQVDEQAQALLVVAHTDPLTGLYTRVHFRARLQQALESEPPPVVATGGSLLIVRLRRLEAMNLRVGYEQVDGLVRALAGVANSYPPRVAGAFAGRLNGGDVGLYLPVPGVCLSTAEAIWAVMRTTLMRVDPAADMAIGGVEGLPWGSASRALAAADEALARAEAQGAFSIVVGGSSPDLVRDGVPGDGSWRQRIAEALHGGEVRLAEAPVLGPDGGLIHLACSVQARLSAEGPFEEVRPRLLLDTRSLLTRRVDLTAVSMALRACASDAKPRCVALSIHSVEEPDFLHEMGRLLESDPRACRLLWLRADAEPPRVLRWLRAVPAWRQLGVRFVAPWADPSVRLAGTNGADGAGAPEGTEGTEGLEGGERAQGAEGSTDPWEGAAALGLHLVVLPWERLVQAAQAPSLKAALRKEVSRLQASGIGVLAGGIDAADPVPLLREFGIAGFGGSAASS